MANTSESTIGAHQAGVTTTEKNGSDRCECKRLPSKGVKKRSKGNNSELAKSKGDEKQNKRSSGGANR